MAMIREWTRERCLASPKAKHLMFDEISKQVRERPETTAEVLRSWLAEDSQKNG